MVRVGGQCVGITDGLYQFAPADAEMAAIEDKIKAEDQWVRGTRKAYRSVAYLMPISPTDDIWPINTVAEELQGAYAAECYANRHNVQGTSPLIQLLIASSGDQPGEYSRTDSVIGQDEQSQNLVAVAGEKSANDPITQTVANRIGQIPSDICVAQADVVLFAGRGRELATLIGDLGNRPCSRPVTIVTGDSAANMPIDASVTDGLKSGTTLELAGEANPAEWDKGSGTVTQQGRAGYNQFSNVFASRFPRVSDNDSNAIMGYDAVLTAITAIRLADMHTTNSGADQELSALQGSRAVLGPSGPISFSADYHDAGVQGSNPVGKVIPILGLLPTSQIVTRQLELPAVTPPGS